MRKLIGIARTVLLLGLVAISACSKSTKVLTPTNEKDLDITPIGPADMTFTVTKVNAGAFNLRFGGLMERGLKPLPDQSDGPATHIEVENFSCGEVHVDMVTLDNFAASAVMNGADSVGIPNLKICPDKEGRTRIQLQMRIRFRSGKWIYHSFQHTALLDPTGLNLRLELLQLGDKTRLVGRWP